jgi:hypothetical protein
MEPERRKVPRIDFRLGVAIKGRQGVEQIMNFSPEVVFIQMEEPSRFKVGSRIFLMTKLPLEEKITRLRSRVAHVATDGIGVQFLDLWSRDNEAHETHFEVFKHTIPLPGT